MEGFFSCLVLASQFTRSSSAYLSKTLPSESLSKTLTVLEETLPSSFKNRIDWKTIMRSSLCLFIGICFLPQIRGLMCFWCSGVGSDRDCERKPVGMKAGPSNVNCSSKFCTTAKVMDLENGTVTSFARFCDNVYRGNRCVKDTKFMTCYQACVYDHCNNGNPSPDYLRVENLLQPDPDSDRKLSAEVSTDSEFHFFTAPLEQQEKNAPNVFKEQSIFKAFTTARPSTTPLSETEPDTTPSTPVVTDTTSTPTTTTTTTTTTTEGAEDTDVVVSESPRLSDNQTTSVAAADSQSSISEEQSTTSPNLVSDDPNHVFTEEPQSDNFGSENSVDDLGSEVPVENPILAPDGLIETLSPEPVKEDLQPVHDAPSDVKDAIVYTTPKPVSTSTEKIENKNAIFKNNTKTEELNLAATQNATDTSGSNRLRNCFSTLTVFTSLILLL